MTMAPDGGAPEDGIAQVFCLGAPLRLVSAYSKSSPRAHKPSMQYHYLEIEAGQHTIVIECSPSGKRVRVIMDERDLI